MCRRLALVAILVVQAILVQTAGVEAQVSLTAVQIRTSRLAPLPGPLSTDIHLEVDEVSGLTIQITTSHGGLATSITGPSPNAQQINPGNVQELGGSFVEFGDGSSESEFFLGPVVAGGFNYLYVIPSLGSGTYTVHVSAAPDLSEDVAIIVMTLRDSPVRAGLVIGPENLFTGFSGIATAAVFEDNLPVLGATVTGTLLSPNSTATNLQLVDSGVGPDHQVGDGLYASSFSLPVDGEYILRAEITGRTSTGVLVGRHVSTSFESRTWSGGQMSEFRDFGVDDTIPPNGLFDRLVLEMDMQVYEAGSYGLQVAIEASDGDTMAGYGRAELANAGVIQASIPAEEIRRVGVDGPYTIKVVRVTRLMPDGEEVQLEITTNGTQQTAAYTVNQFERPAILMTGNVSFSTLDTEPDTKIDTVRPQVGIDVLYPGQYNYHASIMDRCQTRVQTVYGSSSLNGAGEEFITLDFSGAALGANGVNGPFLVRDLVISANVPGRQIGRFDASRVAESPAYPATDFESYASYADCNQNGEPDQCDIRLGASIDADGNGVPDECNNCNGNTKTDGSAKEDWEDIADGTSRDCNGNMVPDECEIVAGSTAGAGPFFCASRCDVDCNHNARPDACDLSSAAWIVERQTLQLPESTYAAIDVSGDYLVVGQASTGSARVFAKSASGWVQEGATLTASPPAAFGQAVAISGNFAVVGAAGQAHVFRRNALGEWQSLHVFTTFIATMTRARLWITRTTPGRRKTHWR